MLVERFIFLLAVSVGEKFRRFGSRPDFFSCVCLQRIQNKKNVSPNRTVVLTLLYMNETDLCRGYLMQPTYEKYS